MSTLWFRSWWPALRSLLAITVLGFATAAAAAVPSRTVLVLGDSLSAEYGLPRGTGWVALLADKLTKDGFDYRVVNASISGETTSGGVTRLPALLKEHQPAVVVIELGANDALRGLQLGATEKNLRQMTQASRAMGARVLLVGMQMPPNYGRAYGERFRSMFGRVAEQERSSLVPFLLEGFADRLDLFQPDRIHPTAAAQPRMLENVWPRLAELLAPSK